MEKYKISDLFQSVYKLSRHTFIKGKWGLVSNETFYCAPAVLTKLLLFHE